MLSPLSTQKQPFPPPCRSAKTRRYRRQSFGDRERLHFDHNNAKERVPIMAQTGA
jgi:hypothetical protein